MKVDVWSYYSVDRPPVKFHCIRRSFDAPTDNYSDIIVGQNVGCFRSPETVAGSLSSLSQLETVYTATTHRQALPNLSRQPADLLPHASEICPGPDPDSRYCCVRIIP